MDKKVVGICPKCGKQLVEGKYAYECETLNDSCDFRCFKEICGVHVSEETLKEILDGDVTEKFHFTKGEKEWDAKLKYSEDEGKVVFEFDRPQVEVIGKCPICGGAIKSTKDFYLCEHYKNPCTLLIGKVIKGTEISKEEALQLIAGETLTKEFTWKTGKTGIAKIHLKDGHTEFIFD